MEAYNNTTWLPEHFWGPRRDSLYVVIPLTVLYGIIFVAGSLGNIITCFVIAKNKYMHTATNYYLLSLAISDLLLLITGLPSEVYQLWSRYPYIFGEIFCIVQGLAAETSANSTVLTITAFTVERYVAICYPFHSHIVTKLSRAVRYIVSIWITAVIFAIPQAIQMGVVYGVDKNGNPIDQLTACALKHPFIPHSFEISMALFFIVPMTIITILYILIGFKLYRPSSISNTKLKEFIAVTRHNNNNKNNNDHNDNHNNGIDNNDDDDIRGPSLRTRENIKRVHKVHHLNHFSYTDHNRSTKRVVNMLIVVVLAFLICWAPFQTQRLLAIYSYDERHTNADLILIYQSITYISGVLYYFSAVINPIVYNIMSHKFRNAFKDTLRNLAESTPEKRNSEDIGSSDTRRNYCEAQHPNSFCCSSNCDDNIEIFSDFTKKPLVVSFRMCRTSSFRSLRDSKSISDTESSVKRKKTCSALVVYPNCKCSSKINH